MGWWFCSLPSPGPACLAIGHPTSTSRWCAASGRSLVLPALSGSLLLILTLQVTLVGSNGREYLFLAKPRDDLRKDVRIMEVAGVLNRLFAKEPASRRRNLYLRRYSILVTVSAHKSCGRGCCYCECHLCAFAGGAGVIREACPMPALLTATLLLVEATCVHSTDSMGVACASAQGLFTQAPAPAQGPLGSLMWV